MSDHKESKMPMTPGPEATDQERLAWRSKALAWYEKYRGIKLNARGLEQERHLIEIMSLHPDELAKRASASLERLRNLLGGDVEIVWSDEVEAM
jgi:hypothetical protein